VLLVIAVRDRALPERHATLFGAAVGTFILVTAAQTALGRLDYGVAQALSSRYALAAEVFWVGLAVGVAPLVARNTTMIVRVFRERIDVTAYAFILFCAVVWLGVGHAAAPPEAVLNASKTRNEPLLTSYVTGVNDEEALRLTHPFEGPEVMLPKVRWLEARRLGPWDSNTTRAELAAAQQRIARPGDLPPCAGAVAAVRRVPNGERFDGWVVPPRGPDAAPYVAVVGRSGASDGVGFVGLYRPDLKASGASTSDTSGFVAYGRGGGVAEFIVALDGESKPLCALRISRG
jgi:hypothetical protein